MHLRKSKLNDFVETIKNIDPTIGLMQTCGLNTSAHVDTRLGLGKVLQVHLDLTSLHFSSQTLKLQLI